MTWEELTALAPARGTLAGYTGTAVLEEADDDARVATFRLQGVAGAAAATARVRVDGDLGLAATVFPGPGCELTAEALVAALRDRLPPAAAPSGTAPAEGPVGPAGADSPAAARGPAAAGRLLIVLVAAIAALLAARALRRPG